MTPNERDDAMSNQEKIEIKTGKPQWNSNGVEGGVDVPIEVTSTIEEEHKTWADVVTLLPREHDGVWSSWGGSIYSMLKSIYAET